MYSSWYRTYKLLLRLYVIYGESLIPEWMAACFNFSCILKNLINRYHTLKLIISIIIILHFIYKRRFICIPIIFYKACVWIKKNIYCFNSNTHNNNKKHYVSYSKIGFNWSFKDYCCIKSITYQFRYSCIVY